MDEIKTTETIEIVDKKTKIIIGAIIGVLVLVIAIFSILIFKSKGIGDKGADNAQVQQKNQENQTPKIDPQVQAQLDALDALRKQQGATQAAPTQEEIQQQLNQLDAIRKKSGATVKAPTQAEIEDQLKELDALRAEAK